MSYSIEDLKSMALPDADPFAKFMCEHYEYVPRVDRDVTVPSSLVINVRPDVNAADIPSIIKYNMRDTTFEVSRYVIAVQLDGILRVPKGKAMFTIYVLVHRATADASYVIVQHAPDGTITYHAADENGECRFETLNQCGDPVGYIVATTGSGVYQIAEVLDFDARQPVDRDRMPEIEARYPLTTFDPDYGDQF